jgi:predicted MFS family arabinose efflux permease
MHPFSLLATLAFAGAIAVTNGLGRFAYALLLPAMRDDLSWSYSVAGWLNTANSLGYGAGAVISMMLFAYWRPAIIFIAGLVLTVATIFFCGFTQDIVWLLLWRLLAGIGSAWVFACGGALMATIYSSDPKRATSAIAIFYAGGGIGIALSGLLLMPVLSKYWTWSMGWIVLGMAGAVLSIWPAILAMRIRGDVVGMSRAPSLWRPFLPIIGAYFLFGIGYIVYLTFVIAWLKEMQLGIAQSVGVWIWLGIAVTASGWIWRRAMASWWPSKTFAAATLITGLGAMLPLLSNNLLMLLASALLVGGSFFMVPSAVMALIRISFPQPQWAKMMSLMTLIFAAGQGVSPVFAGLIADKFSLNTTMWISILILILAATFALLQPGTSQKNRLTS